MISRRAGMLSVLPFIVAIFHTSNLARADIEFQAKVITSEEALQSKVFKRLSPLLNEPGPPKEETFRIWIKGHLIRVEKDGEIQIYDVSTDTLTFLDPEAKEGASFPAERLKQYRKDEWENRSVLMTLIGESLPRESKWPPHFVSLASPLSAAIPFLKVQRDSTAKKREVNQYLKHQAVELGVADFPMKFRWVSTNEKKTLLGYLCRKYDAYQNKEKIYEAWITVEISSQGQWATFARFLALYGGYHPSFLETYGKLPGIPLWEKRRKNTAFGFAWEEIMIESLSMSNPNNNLFTIPVDYKEVPYL